VSSLFLFAWLGAWSATAAAPAPPAPEITLDERIVEVHELLEQYPDVPELHVELGNLYLAKNWDKDAARSYRRALSLDGRNLDARYNLGVIHLLNRDFRRAASAFQQVVKKSSKHARAHFNLGAANEGLRRHDEAIESYKRAFELEPGLREVHNNPALATSNLIYLSQVKLYLETSGSTALPVAAPDWQAALAEAEARPGAGVAPGARARVEEKPLPQGWLGQRKMERAARKKEKAAAREAKRAEKKARKAEKKASKEGEPVEKAPALEGTSEVPPKEALKEGEEAAPLTREERREQRRMERAARKEEKAAAREAKRAEREARKEKRAAERAAEKEAKRLEKEAEKARKAEEKEKEESQKEDAAPEGNSSSKPSS
jgi:hypothetical protein